MRRRRVHCQAALCRAAENNGWVSSALRATSVHVPEPARIVIGYPVASIRPVEMEARHDHALRRLRTLMVKAAGRVAASSFSTRNEPDMPRCMTSTAPSSRSARRYFARRESAAMRLPCSRAAKSLGKGKRKSGRRASTRSNTRAFHGRGKTPPHCFNLRQFGHGFSLATRRPCANPRACACRAFPFLSFPLAVGQAKGNISMSDARASRPEEMSRSYGFREVDAGRKAADGRRRLPQGGAALRPDERRHVRRHAPAVEGCDGDAAQPAAPCGLDLP